MIFIDDISQSLTSASIKLFADDALAYMAVEGEHDRLSFQEDLHRLCDWADENQMAFNAKKCEIVIFQKIESKV